MKRYFCTYFDSNYLVRGLAMCRSLAHWSPQLTIFVLALDDICYEFLVALADHSYLVPIRQAELEAFDQELRSCKGTRSRTEYIFTMTPCLPRFLLRRHAEIDLITYLDADLWFFSSPEPIYQELQGGSVGIIPHRFAANVRHLASLRGIFNVGWISYANDREGNLCLDWYRDRCLEWCYDRVEDGRFADQKYLEGFSKVAAGVVTITHPGANLASWNLGDFDTVVEDGLVLVNGQELIFFHYQGVKRLSGPNYDCGLFAFRLRLSSALRQEIFCRYIHTVMAIKMEYDLELPDFTYAKRYSSRFPRLTAVAGKVFDLVKMTLGFGVSCRKGTLDSAQV